MANSSLQHAAAVPEPANSSQGFGVNIQVLSCRDLLQLDVEETLK